MKYSPDVQISMAPQHLPVNTVYVECITLVRVSIIYSHRLDFALKKTFIFVNFFTAV